MEREYENHATPHEGIWGKKAHEVSYGEPCPVCGSRVDEYGFCSCGAGSE